MLATIIDDTNLQDIIYDNDWTADCMINPQDYDEQHSAIAPYELYKATSNENEANN